MLYMLWLLTDETEHFTDTDLKTGTRVTIKTKYGKFLSICDGAQCGDCCVNNLCLTDELLGDKSIFEFYVHNSNKDAPIVSIKNIASDWLFQCEGCCKSCKHIICADSGNVNMDNGKFTLIKNNGSYLLKANNTQYLQLCLDCNTSCKLICTKPLESIDSDNLGLTFEIV